MSLIRHPVWKDALTKSVFSSTKPCNSASCFSVPLVTSTVSRALEFFHYAGCIRILSGAVVDGVRTAPSRTAPRTSVGKQHWAHDTPSGILQLVGLVDCRFLPISLAQSANTAFMDWLLSTTEVWCQHLVAIPGDWMVIWNKGIIGKLLWLLKFL